MQRILNFLRDESGIETLEYAMIGGLIAIAAVAIYMTSTWETNVVTRLNDATEAGGAIP